MPHNNYTVEDNETHNLAAVHLYKRYPQAFRINPHETDEAVSEAEIRMMVDMGNESGVIETNEKS